MSGAAGRDGKGEGQTAGLAFPKELKEFRRVVSVCAIKDIGAWRVTAPRVLKFIESDEYILICPDTQISDFTAVTPPGWRIAGDDSFADSYDFARVKGLVRGLNQGNVGHLFQQFLKMNAVIDPSLGAEDRVLIWDADTVPLKKISFTRRMTGTIEYYWGTEYHPNYFETIHILTGLRKNTGHSFIAQCFPTKVGWAREAVRAISGTGSDFYIRAVLDYLPGLDTQEFSEYETLGTWNFEKYPESVAFKSENHWTRHGSKWLGSELKGPLTGFFLFLLSLKYDYAAFEEWEDRVPVSRLFVRLLVKIFQKVLPIPKSGD